MLNRLRDAQKRLDKLEGKTRPQRMRYANPPKVGDEINTSDDLRVRIVAPGEELVIGLSTELLEATNHA